MPPKPVAQWSVDDVAVWLSAIGLGAHAGPFQENAVDGSLLLTLSQGDFTSDLGLTNLQAKKAMNELDFAKSLSSSGDTGELQDEINKLTANMADLQAQLAQKDAEIAELQKQVPQQAAPRAAPAPAPAHHPPPAPRPVGHPVIREGARGAAGGAVKGAVVGAILPGMSAGDGAKAGAAVGGMSGGARGLRARRRFG